MATYKGRGLFINEQESWEDPALARRNVLVDEDGNIISDSNPLPVVINMQENTENKRGSDCTGSDGATNRVLTLTNSRLSSNEDVFVNGIRLTINVDYTITHNTSNSTITFLGEIYDSDYITVRYQT